MYSEYIITETMAKELLKGRKGDEKKMDNQKYLCHVINEQFGLLYPCKKVTVGL